MLHLELKPDHLVGLAAAAAPEGQPEGRMTVEYDEANAVLMVFSALVMLRPKEFILVLALLRQRTRWQQTPGQVPIGLGIGALAELIHSGSTYSVRRQLTQAALKVTALGIRIYALYGEDQYFVLFAPEVGKPPNKEALHDLPLQIIH